jgi:hypothetical protein
MAVRSTATPKAVPKEIAEKLKDKNLVRELTLRKGVDKVQQLPYPFDMSEPEINLVTQRVFAKDDFMPFPPGVAAST